MPVKRPVPGWPEERLEAGPTEDPLILLSGQAHVGGAPYRVVAVRMNPVTLAVDYRYDVGEEVHADYQLENTLEELTFLDDIEKTVLVPPGQGQYGVWTLPSANTGGA